MKLKGIIAIAISAIALNTVSFADADIVVKYNGDALCFAEKPIIRNDKTLVQLRPIAEAMELNIEYIEDKGEVVLSDSQTTVVFENNSDIIRINDREFTMIAPAINYHDYTFVPARDLAEPFGKVVGYDGEMKMVTISDPTEEGAPEDEVENVTDESTNERPEANKVEESNTEEIVAEAEEEAVVLFPLTDVPSGSGKYESHYYYQSQPELPFENKGRGFCWVCSYAMIISNVTDSKVTPIEIANINLESGFGASTTYHSKIMDTYGCEFVPALSEESPYYGGFDALGKGETTIKFEDEAGLFAAFKEMLDLFDDGILVRYEGYPHTMMAVGYDDDTIYFNDPGIAGAEHVPFNETCLKNFSICDISYVQAVRTTRGE